MTRNRVYAVLLGMFLVGYIGWGLSRISFNIDILRLLPSHLRQVEGLSLFLKNFALPDELIVTIESADSEKAKVESESLAAKLGSHHELVRNAVSKPPWESNPAGLSEFLAFLLINQPAQEARGGAMRLSSANAEATLQETLEQLNTTASPEVMTMLGYDPYRVFSGIWEKGFGTLAGNSEFSSKDGTFRVVYVQSAIPLNNYKKAAEWIKEVKKICGVPASGVTLRFTGEPAFVAEISTGMQSDMVSSAFVTLALICLVFWLCYGQFYPLKWLVILLQLIFLLSLATAGLFLKELTVVGAGFASVMIGLSVDYGYFIYQQSTRHDGSLRSLRRFCLRNIAWTSGTTAAAFFALNLSSLPGLSQLGNMVGIGVCIGAVVMLLLFAPLALSFRRTDKQPPVSRIGPIFESPLFMTWGSRVAAGVVLLFLGALLVKGFPESDFSASTFRPKHSESQAALERLYSRLQDDRGMLSLVVTAGSSKEELSRLQRVQTSLEAAIKSGKARSFLSPLSVWPDSSLQSTNIAVLMGLTQQLPRLKDTLIKGGFTEEAFVLTSSVLEHIHSWSSSPTPVWPSGSESDWILRRMVRHEAGKYLAMGVIEPTPGCEQELIEALQNDGVYVVSWSLLGGELKKRLPSEILHVSAGLLGGILLILAVALRDMRALFLFAATTVVVLACLAGAMSLLGMKWGFFNLAAVLLLLGTGTDYSILMLLSIKRNGHDVDKAQRDLGLVIFLCCISASAGFGTLAWAGNMGLATLGKTCALGLLIDGLISLFLLPVACRHFLVCKSRS